jgi:phosphatidylserine/phosphatidylglycerophosphate/cardiolipin synthase-like enzyme
LILLLPAGKKTRATHKKNNSLPRSMKVKNIPIQLWFTPTVRKVDLQEARAVIEAAQQAILFLMFNPGPQETLLNKILEKAQSASNGNRLYIRGALNQDPSTARQNVQLFHESNSEKADFNVVLPAAIDEATEWFAREIRKLPKGIAMVHSKVVVVDPFGEHPVVITGSHNLGPKASSGNDENLLIFRDAHGLAAAYATNVMSIYHQYRWRLRRQLQSASKRWKGLQDGDQWQQGYLQDGSMGLRELSFWVGEQSDGV